VIVPTAGNVMCGYDVAVMIVDGLIARSEAVPLVPPIDRAVAAAEGYAAVGVGATDDNRSGRERRRRDDLTTACSGAGPDCARAAGTAWVGEAGICLGRSVGPALDLVDRVIGVVSRGSVGCADPVYGDVAAHAGWSIAVAQRAAEVGAYEPRAWAAGASTDPTCPGPLGDAREVHGDRRSRRS
jgi:hypothetical protein